MILEIETLFSLFCQKDQGTGPDPCLSCEYSILWEGSTSSREQVGNLFSSSNDKTHTIPLIKYRCVRYLTPGPCKIFIIKY